MVLNYIFLSINRGYWLLDIGYWFSFLSLCEAKRQLPTAKSSNYYTLKSYFYSAQRYFIFNYIVLKSLFFC